MCPLLKCASNYLRTAAPQFLDDIWKEEALQGHDVYFFNSENHPVLVVVFFLSFSCLFLLFFLLFRILLKCAQVQS